MRLRGLILAVQFLTRLPTPQLRDFRQEEESMAPSMNLFDSPGGDHDD